MRLSVFLGVLVAMALCEAVFPRKNRTMPRGRRWVTNAALVIIDTTLLRILFPIAAVGVALTAQNKGWGLFNMLELPLWLEIITAMIILDLLIYIQHVAFHRIPLFWAMHKVHHADRDIDVTTAIRFHPFEIIVSMAYKMACVALLGPAVIAVILFEIILNGCALFNHANLRLSPAIDKALRGFIVTPDMHRIHHSVHSTETNSNYGFSLSLWDQLFRTYRSAPEDGHDAMSIGLSEAQTAKPNLLGWSLLFPFKRSSKQV